MRTCHHINQDSKKLGWKNSQAELDSFIDGVVFTKEYNGVKRERPEGVFVTRERARRPITVPKQLVTRIIMRMITRTIG
jgi:hypothetical protein